MKISISNIILICFVSINTINAQIDPSLLKRTVKDTTKILNMDAIYNRPTLNINKRLM